MSNEMYRACIEAFNVCATACNHCAASCLKEPDVKMMSKCIALDMDCAQMCTVAAAVMARGSEHYQEICKVCADICLSCGDECAKHDKTHCKECAKACNHCAEECRKMVTMA